MTYEFKVGDEVKCVLQAGNSRSRGAGWKIDKVFIIGKITGHGNETILWPDDGTSGIFIDEVKHCKVDNWKRRLTK